MKHFSSLPNGARVKRPVRNQIELVPGSLDDRVPDDHQVRALWAYVDSLDLGPLYEEIRAVEGGPGRDRVDPKILVTLWMYATIESISSAHHLDALCKRDDVYKWICGGVGVNYGMLSKFRTAHVEFQDQLFTNSIAALTHQNLVTLKRVAQDGMRVRANAGSKSFRRERTLQECLKQAREQVQTLREKGEQEDSLENARQEAARKRAIEERPKRIEKALEEMVELQDQKEKQTMNLLAEFLRKARRGRRPNIVWP